MQTHVIQFFGGPHDGRAVQLATVRPVVYACASPDNPSLYHRCEGTPKAEYRLIDGRYVYAGVAKPG